MKIVLLDKRHEKVQVDNKTIRVDGRRIPLHLTDFVIISDAVDLRIPDLLKITEEGIGVLAIDRRNRMMLSCSARAKNAELKASQYRAFERKRLEIAKRIVQEKVSLHIANIPSLKDKSFERETLEKIHEATSLERLLGIEGSFSKRYFDAYFRYVPKTWHKGTRSKRPPRDPLNALLSFGYMLMYYRIASRLIASGFEPSIGFLHTPFRDHYALASDMMEYFRAGINTLVHQCVLDGSVNLEDFTRKGGRVFLRYEGRKRIWRIFTEWIEAQESSLYLRITELKRMIDEKETGSAE